MIVSDYRIAIRRQLGLSDSDTVVSDTVLLWALNGALKTISTDRDWPWLYQEAVANTVSGTSNYALPTGHTRTVFITTDAGTPLGTDTHLGMAGDRATTGLATSYVIQDDELRLFPTPNSAVQIVHAYYRVEPTLVNVGDAPLIPDAYSEWVVYEAALKVAIRNNNTERVEVLRAETVKIRQGILDNYRRSHAPARIRRTRDSIWTDA